MCSQIGYNRACGLVEVGEYEAAELELKLTIKLGERACTLALWHE